MTYMSLFFKALCANIPHLEFCFRGDGRCKLINFPDACQSALHCGLGVLLIDHKLGQRWVANCMIATGVGQYC